MRDEVRQCRPLDQFHDQRGRAVSFLQAVDGRDVGMVERGQDFGFALEPGQPLRITGQRCRQDLDADGPFQVGVGGHNIRATFCRDN